MDMALNSRTQVSIPTEKISYKKASNGTIYVYYTTKSYRRKTDNKPTSDEVLIGRKDPVTQKLIPNNKYYEIFDIKDINYTPLSIRTYGTYFLLERISEKLGLKEILKSVFPKTWCEILTIAMYMICRGNVVKHCSYWCEETYNSLKQPLIAQRISELFASITFDERMSFFRKWIANKSEDEYIAYDVTSISSYSTKISDVEYGYNRDGEDLPQINLGMYTGEKSKMPFFYNTYPGSITDKEQLIHMMKFSKEVGINKAKYVMDKGFYKKDNLNYMVKEDHKFIICLSNSLKFVKKYIEALKPQIQSHLNWINKYQLFGVCIQYQQDKILSNVHLIYNPDKQSEEQKAIFATIEKLEQELKELKGLPLEIKKYTRFFNIQISDPNKRDEFKFEKNDELITKALMTTGFVVFITTDLTLTTERVIEIYRGKDVIEKNFCELKNELDFSRLKTHLNQTTDGKIFVGFISLILRTYMLHRILNTKNKTFNLSLQEVVLELEKIKFTALSNQKTTLVALTKLQKDILSTFEINNDELEKSLEFLP